VPALLACTVACFAAMALRGGEGLRRAELEGLASAHQTHIAHAAALARLHQKSGGGGSKYQRELASLAKRAGPSRRNALAKLEALRKRSDGDNVPQTGSKHKIPQALRAMENLANKRADFSRGHAGSGAEMLGKLERKHGIKSSKDMLAEIMSLRHYKSANKQISEMQHGFEAHSSMSHRVMKSIGSSEAQSKQKAEAKRQAASALRLEAGRYSRNAMLRRTEHTVEKTIGRGLVETFGPIKKILHHDEKVLDDLVSPRKQRERRNEIVDDAAQTVKRQLRRTLRREADAKIKKEKIAMFHKSRKYLSQVPCLPTMFSLFNNTTRAHTHIRSLYRTHARELTSRHVRCTPGPRRP
jgi:hypothetical protein